jgi:hypothetical protein
MPDQRFTMLKQWNPMNLREDAITAACAVFLEKDWPIEGHAALKRSPSSNCLCCQHGIKNLRIS